MTEYLQASDGGSVFDCHQLLNKFYQDHVQLGKDRRDELAHFRDANLKQLSSGLAALGPVAGASATDFEDDLNQGSYAMHTLNQHRSKEYDIDTGVIFLPENIPQNPRETRMRVADALRQNCGSFLSFRQPRTGLLQYANARRSNSSGLRDRLRGHESTLRPARDAAVAPPPVASSTTTSLKGC